MRDPKHAGDLLKGILADVGSKASRARFADALRTVAVATLLVALAGWVDEGIQGLLPNRVYDLRDVGLNAGAGALAAGFAAIHRRLGAPGAPGAGSR